jgi:Uma2 family endonuclease
VATTADVLRKPANLETDEEVKPSPKRLHAIVQERIIFLLTKEMGLDLALPALAVAVLDDEGRNIVPDVIALGASAQFENEILSTGADLAVEIMSPKQQFSHLIGKCERLLVSGIVPTCWIIWPEHQTAYNFDLPHGLLQETTKLHFGSTSASRSVTLSLVDVVGNLPIEE